jgi:hypothetical protein
MSRKYVPTFLKNQDFEGAGAKPIVNTSRPAMEAPKLVPATLASLTSNGAAATATTTATTGGSNKSFGSKFAEQARVAEDPNYVPPPKPINFTSEDDFPTLGGGSSPKKSVVSNHCFKTSNTPTNTVIIDSEEYDVPTLATTGNKWANMAKGWAKHKEDEEERARKKKMLEDQMLREAELMKSIPIIGMRRRNRYDDDDDYSDYDPQEKNENYIPEEEDSYGMPDDDENEKNILQDVEDEQEEFNSNIGWDGRKRDDLY